MASGANVTNVLAFTQNNIHLSSNFKPHTCVAEYEACLVVNMEFQIQKLNAVDNYRSILQHEKTEKTYTYT